MTDCSFADGSTAGVDKLKEINISTDKTQSQIESEFLFWQNLELVFNENLTGNTSTLTFTIKNNAQTGASEYIAINVGVSSTLADNATVTVSNTSNSTGSCLGPQESVMYTITFTIEDKSANASISGFTIIFDMQRETEPQIIPDVSEIENLTFTLNSPESGQASVQMVDAATTIGDIEIPVQVMSDGVVYDVTSIGNNAFWRCSGLTSIKIPDSVTSIGNSAFFECSGIKEPIIIPSSVTSLGTAAFCGCDNVPYVYLPSSINKLYYGDLNVFDGVDCVYAESAEGPELISGGGISPVFAPFDYGYSEATGEQVSKYGARVIFDCKEICQNDEYEYVIKNDNTIIITKYIGVATNVVVPEEIDGLKVICLASYSFSGNATLEMVKIDAGIKFLNDGCFSDCQNLNTILIYAGDLKIYGAAFAECVNLNTIFISATEDETLWNEDYGIARVEFMEFSGDEENCACLTAFDNCPLSNGLYLDVPCPGVPDIDNTGYFGWKPFSSSGLQTIYTTSKFYEWGEDWIGSDYNLYIEWVDNDDLCYKVLLQIEDAFI